MPNLTGISLGRYQLLEPLGEGGMAVVYKAFDTHLECEVAVKVIRLDQLAPASLEHTIKRFEREAKEVAKLNHPNIVRVIDYGEHDNIPYLVMPYLTGGTLKQFLGKPMLYSEAAALVLPIARALDYAHKHKMVHRDIKPSNILITDSGDVMLTDFGIVKILDQQEGSTLTGTGMGLGTPEYMAPEQWFGKSSPAVDQYSLGVVLYELITGRKPYTADTPAAILIKQTNEPLPRPKTFVADLPAEVEGILFKALAKEPENRYPSMAELLQSLETIVTGRSVSAIKNNQQLPDESIADALVTQDSITPDLTSIDFPKKTTTITPQPNARPDNQIVSEPGKVGISDIKKTPIARILIGVVVLIAAIVLISKGRVWFSAAPTQSPTQTSVMVQEPIFSDTKIMTNEKEGMISVYIPAGEFKMGSNEGITVEKPVHSVYLDAYWIDQTEVTNAMYKKCVSDKACTLPLDLRFYENLDYTDHPVVFVTWDQAKNYCEWAGRKLPTEAQWENAAKGPEGGNYPWGEAAPNCELLNFSDCLGDTSAVGKYPAGKSSYDTYDMAGNVWEWVQDWYGQYPSKEVNNQLGPSFGDYHIQRGGGWDSTENLSRATVRSLRTSLYKSDNLGFRCAKQAD